MRKCTNSQQQSNRKTLDTWTTLR